jgi:hypothetical protein
VGAPQRNLQGEADHVLALLNQLSDNTLSAAVEGVSNWLESWRRQVVASASGLPVWLRIWPIAVKATNAKRENEGDADLSVPPAPRTTIGSLWISTHSTRLPANLSACSWLRVLRFNKYRIPLPLEVLRDKCGMS